MVFILNSSEDILKGIADRARKRRLSLNLSQKSLAQRSGVKYGTLKKFEQTGRISLESLLRLAFALGETDNFEHLFAYHAEKLPATLEELMKDDTRQRGRQ